MFWRTRSRFETAEADARKFWYDECARVEGELAALKTENADLRKNLKELADLTKHFVEML